MVRAHASCWRPLADLAPSWSPPTCYDRAEGQVEQVEPLARLGARPSRDRGAAPRGSSAPGGPAGRSASALRAAGWQVVGLLGRGDDVRAAAGRRRPACVDRHARRRHRRGGRGRSSPTPEPVVAHLAGSLGLDVLAAPPARRGRCTRWSSLPDAERRAPSGCVGRLVRGRRRPARRSGSVADLGGRWFEVADDDRAAYHAAACMASNHLVALLGQVERVAGGVGVPLEAYLDLARATLDNVAELGPAAALTGPAARGDWATVDRHLAALDPSERAGLPTPWPPAARRLVDDDGLPADLPSSATGRAAERVRPRCTTPSPAFRAALDAERAAGRHASGFVPTMGYLHDGPRAR